LYTARLARFVLLAAITLIIPAGCSQSGLPKLAAVSGVVTLDGVPYPNAKVVFSPAKGRPSEGVTDGNGKYELMYLPEVKGAELGNHTVSITTQYQAPENPTGNEPQFKEPLPSKYHVTSTLTATVNEGANEVSFPLLRK